MHPNAIECRVFLFSFMICFFLSFVIFFLRFLSFALFSFNIYCDVKRNRFHTNPSILDYAFSVYLGSSLELSMLTIILFSISLCLSFSLFFFIGLFPLHICPVYFALLRVFYYSYMCVCVCYLFLFISFHPIFHVMTHSYFLHHSIYISNTHTPLKLNKYCYFFFVSFSLESCLFIFLIYFI